MNKQVKQQILVVAFGVTLFAALVNLNAVAGFFRTFTSILSPVFSGLLLAFILSVPMLGIARRLTGIFPRLKEKTVGTDNGLCCGVGMLAVRIGNPAVDCVGQKHC